MIDLKNLIKQLTEDEKDKFVKIVNIIFLNIIILFYIQLKKK